MRVRPANSADIPAILPMIAQICALHQAWDPAKYRFLPNPERSYAGWLEELIQKPRDLCLVAEEGSESPMLVAFLIATVEREIPIYQLKHYGFVHDLWVEEAYRQRGIAQQMVQRTIDHFTQLGIQQIRLDTAMPNEAARKLFATCGFRASTVEMLMELGDRQHQLVG